jgi:HlyD family secretion protein
MKNLLKKFKRLSRRKKALVIGGVIVAFMIIRVVTGGAAEEDTSDARRSVKLLSVAEYQEDNATIRAVGEIEALEDVQVQSLVTAKVDSINVTLGQEVQKGDLLVQLDNDALSAQLAQAAASINRMQSSVDQRLAGATDEEIAQSAAAVTSAEAALTQAQAQLEQTQTSTASAITNAELALAIAESNLENNTDSTDLTLESGIEDGVNAAYTAVVSAENALATLTDYQFLYFSGNNPTGNALADAKELAVESLLGQSNAGRWGNTNLSGLNGGAKLEVNELLVMASPDADEVIDALESVQDALADLDAAYAELQGAMSTAYASAASSTDKSTVSSTRTTIQSQATAVANAVQTIESAELGVASGTDTYQLAYEQAEQTLADAISSAATSVASAEALVIIQEASVQQAQAAYDLLIADPRDVDLAGLNASVSEAQAAYSLIAANQDDYSIRAPFAGTVASVPVSTGDLVTTGQRIVSLVSDGGYQVRVYVNEDDRKLISVGDQVMIQGDVTGEVTQVAPSIDPETKKVELIIAVTDEEPNLIIGEFVEVEIFMSQNTEEETFVLPFRAVKTTSSASYVYTVSDNGEVASHEVELGRIIGDSVEVTAGIAGDWEILSSTRSVRVGEQVDVK